MASSSLEMEGLQKRLRHKAMDWLARREYSRHELAVKLERKFGRAFKQAIRADEAPDVAETNQAEQHDTPELPIKSVIDWLEERGFVSDKRCARLFARSHIGRGHGPFRIRQELVFRKGLNKELVEAELKAQQCDWHELAFNTLKKRFPNDPETLKERAKQLRFLQARGFTADQCYRALDMKEGDINE